MKIQRERAIPDEAYNLIPDFVKESISDPADIKKMAVDIVQAITPPAPRMGEMTVSSRRRLFGPDSSYNNFVGDGYFRSANIPLNVLDAMRRDYQVALGMAIVKFPITQLKFTIECDNPLQKEFIKYNIQDKWATMVSDFLKSMDFGFAGFEKVWGNEILNIDPGKNLRKSNERSWVVLKKMKPLHPAYVIVRVDDGGNFEGITQNQFGEVIRLPRNKSMVITNNEEFQNYFGRSRMVAAYEAWYWKQISIQFFLRYVERFSIPPYKISYPKGFVRAANNQQVDNSEIAMNMGTAISSYGNVAVPSERWDNGERKWDIETMDQSKMSIKPNDVVGFWDMQTLKGLLVPDKTSLGAMDPETASEVFLSSLASTVKHIEEKMNREVVEPLSAWNFPVDERSECRFNIDDIDFKRKSEMRKLMSKLVDLSSTFIKNTPGLPFNIWPDMKKIYEGLDIPATEFKIYQPTVLDPNGKVIKEKAKKKNPNLNKGPEKGEGTSGNISRKGPDGDPNDDDKIDEQGAL